MPRKKKLPNQKQFSATESCEEKHLYVEAEVPPGHDVPIFDVYIGTTTENFEEKIRKKLLESEHQAKLSSETPLDQKE